MPPEVNVRLCCGLSAQNIQILEELLGLRIGQAGARQTVHGQPVHREAVHGQPVHRQAIHGEAIHGEAIHGQPVHGQPVHGQPVVDDCRDADRRSRFFAGSSTGEGAGGEPKETQTSGHAIGNHDSSIGRLVLVL